MFNCDNNSTIDTVQVALRIRPLSSQEIKEGCDECIDVFPGEQQVQIKDLAFTYNYVFPQHIDQKQFYTTAVKSRVEKLFQGYNATILAYGQTGSGKTYTMGTNYIGSEGDSSNFGVIQQAVIDIFHYIENHEDNFYFMVTISFIEIYQEQIYDLLSEKDREQCILEIREDANKAIHLPGVTEVPVTSTLETMMVLQKGSIGRMTGSTAMNETSSRSHAVFTIKITKRNRRDKNSLITSKFRLVDLAGSERIKKTKTCGERFKEGVNINKALLSLGNVISALGHGSNRSYISYRDSKLTRLLQDSLGGNSLTLMIACVSPADYNMEETISTLRFADRARRIRNKPIINQDPKSAEILRLNNLVNELRLQLEGKLPTQCEYSNEKLEEELKKEKAKYAELLMKYKKVTKHLSNILFENTNLCEKALLAEAAKDKIDHKLKELTEQCNQTIEEIQNVSDRKNYSKNRFVEYMEKIRSKLEDLLTEIMKSNEEMIDHEDKFPIVRDTDKVDGELLLNEDQAMLEEEQRLMDQVALNQDIQTLNRAMAIKVTIIKLILANYNDLLTSPTSLKQNEKNLVDFEKERDKLIQQMKKTKKKSPSHEELETKIEALENLISCLKTKYHMKANIDETKAKNDARIASINAELKALKATKENIIKQMRHECEKFSKWKKDKEDREQVTAVAMMESLHVKQENVVERKMKKSVAVNKRVEEAPEEEKQSPIERNAKGSFVEDVIQQYIEQELEVHLRVMEAETLLEELMEKRAWLTERIEIKCNYSDNESNMEKIFDLECDSLAIQAQITDLQQEILSADLENKLRTQWDIIQTTLEARVALKCLFELLVQAKRELQSQAERSYQAGYQELKEACDRIMVKNENCETGLGRQEEQQENLPGETLEQLPSTSNMVTRRNRIKTQIKDFEYTEISDDDTRDSMEDPEWIYTPLLKRIQRAQRSRRSQLMMNLANEAAPQDRPEGKRGSSGVPHCTCRGSCSNKLCGCVKSMLTCGNHCRCQPSICRNRRPHHEDVNEDDSSS